MRAAVDAGGYVAGVTARDERLPMMDGWVEALDAATWRTYYWNAVSHESRWERPETGGAAAAVTAPLLPPAAADCAIVAGWGGGGLTDDNTHWHVRDDAGSHLPPGWSEVVEDSTGRTYFYHAESGETTWERPGGGGVGGGGGGGGGGFGAAAAAGAPPPPPNHAVEVEEEDGPEPAARLVVALVCWRSVPPCGAIILHVITQPASSGYVRAGRLCRHGRLRLLICRRHCVLVGATVRKGAGASEAQPRVPELGSVGDEHTVVFFLIAMLTSWCMVPRARCAVAGMRTVKMRGGTAAAAAGEECFQRLVAP